MIPCLSNADDSTGYTIYVSSPCLRCTYLGPFREYTVSWIYLYVYYIYIYIHKVIQILTILHLPKTKNKPNGCLFLGDPPPEKTTCFPLKPPNNYVPLKPPNSWFPHKTNRPWSNCHLSEAILAFLSLFLFPQPPVRLANIHKSQRNPKGSISLALPVQE